MMVDVPQLANDEELRPRDAGFLDRFTESLFAAIKPGSIKVPAWKILALASHWSRGKIKIRRCRDETYLYPILMASSIAFFAKCVFLSSFSSIVPCKVPNPA